MSSQKRRGICQFFDCRARRFAEDTDGVSLVEFAFMFPILVMILMMTITLSHVMMVDRKVTIAAQAAADLIAQRGAVDLGDIQDIDRAVVLMMQPFVADYDMSIAHVPFDVPAGDADMNLGVAWRGVINGAPQISDGEAEAAADGGSINGPTGLTGAMGRPGDAVIMLRMNFQYVSLWRTDFELLGLRFPGTLTFTKLAFARPRLNQQIAADASLYVVN